MFGGIRRRELLPKGLCRSSQKGAMLTKKLNAFSSSLVTEKFLVVKNSGKKKVAIALPVIAYDAK